jgi:serine/threonine protein kinase
MTEDHKADPRTALSGRFVFEQQLGEGGFGTVYRARDTLRDATVAVKVLTRVDPVSLFNFKTEFRALTCLVHPNLVQLHELLARDGQWLLSMELIEGGDFLAFVRPLGPDQRAAGSRPSGQEASPGTTSSITPSVGEIPWGNSQSVVPILASDGPSESDTARGAKQRKPRRTGALDESRLRSALRQLCDGLGALHQANRLHRDLKPANVLVCAEGGRVAICDFGLVTEGGVGPRVGQEGDPSGSSPTTGGRSRGREKIVGTVAYMSPEQAMGEPLTSASDWYAVGVMLYQALCDEMPFSPRLSFRDALLAKQRGAPVHPCLLVENAPKDLADLAIALLSPEPTRRPGHAEVVALLERRTKHTSAAPKAREQLFGRHEQLAQLQAAFARARSGLATVAMVAGRSGMGKSALVQRFLDDVARHHAAVVLAGRCYEREELPYKAFDPLLDALSTHLLQQDQLALAELLPEHIHELANLFPVLRRVPVIANGFRASDVGDPLEQRGRAFRALRELCRTLAQQKPLVFYIDDLQWGDLDSGQIFVELLRLPQPPAVLLVCAFRSEDEEQSPLLSALRKTHLPEAGIARPVEVRVEALAEAESQQLAASLLEGCQDAAAAVQFVAAEAAGRPFFVRELALYVRARGALPQQLTLESLIEARFSALSPESRSLLSIIAVAGRPERRAVIQRAAKLGEKSMAALHALEAQNFIHSSGSRADDRIEAYHDRIRETVYQLLGKPERARLHRELALCLERNQEPDSEALLEHWRGAGEREKAGAYALEAAHKAEAALAFERAARLYRETLTLRALSVTQTRELEERLGHALALCGRGIEAADAFFRALPGAPAASAMQLRSMATSQLLRAGQVARALHELKNARSLLGMAVPTTNLVTVFMLLWRRARIRLKRMTFKRRARPAALAALLRADMLWEVGSGLSCMDLLRGSVYQAEYLLLALKLGDPLRLARALSIEAIMCATANKNPARTQLFIDRGYETAGISGELGATSVAKGTAGVCRMLEGRFREAASLTRLARESIRDRVHPTRAWEQVTMVFFELQSVACLGDVRELIERVPEVLRDAEARGDLYATVCYRTWRCSWAWLGPDRPDEARRQAQLAEGQWNQAGYHLQHWYTTQALGEIDLYLDAVEASKTRLDAEWKRMFFLQQIQHTRIEMWYLRARVLLATARRAFDPALLKAARADANRLRKERTLWSGALSRLLLACAASFETPNEALAILQEVEGQFDVIDMRLHAAVARYRRGELMRGEQGAELVREASEQIRSLGVARPEAFVQMLAPGFPVATA